jgi:hypothetical protein
VTYRSDLHAAHETIARLEHELAQHRRPLPTWLHTVAVVALVAFAGMSALAWLRTFDRRYVTSFREPIRQRRCLVVVDGFYEWRRDGKRKQPFHIRREDGKPFALGGVWDRWKRKGAPRDAPRLETCSVVTVDPQVEVAALHDRVPLILPED